MSSVATKLLLVRFALDVQFWFPTWYFLLKFQGFSTAEAVAADAIFHAAILLLELPLGRLVAAIGRVRSLQISVLMTAVTFIALPLCSSSWVLFAVWFSWGALWAFSSGLDTAYTWEVAESGDVKMEPHRFLALTRLVTGASVGISLSTAGLLFELNPKFPYFATALLAILVFPLTLKLPEPISTQKTQSVGKSHLISFLHGTPDLHQSVLLLAAALTCSISVRILIQPVGTDYGISPSQIGIFYAVFALFVSVGSSLGAFQGKLASLKVGWSLVLMFSLLHVLVGLLVDSGTKIIWSAALMTFCGLLFGQVRSISEVKLSKSCVPRQRVTILSISSAISGLAMVIVRPMIMWGYDRAGVVVGLLPVTMMGILSALGAILIRKKVNA